MDKKCQNKEEKVYIVDAKLTHPTKAKKSQLNNEKEHTK